MTQETINSLNNTEHIKTVMKSIEKTFDYYNKKYDFQPEIKAKPHEKAKIDQLSFRWNALNNRLNQLNK